MEELDFFLVYQKNNLVFRNTMNQILFVWYDFSIPICSLIIYEVFNLFPYPQSTSLWWNFSDKW
jgi:hypothetical protein